jgi:hypothetical protein
VEQRGWKRYVNWLANGNLTCPGVNWDMALHKDITLPWFGGEHSTLQVRCETFNTFNHPQWSAASGSGVNTGCTGTPNEDGSSAFGCPCGGHEYNLGIGQVSVARTPRNMQFALKLLF